jgi:tRNA A-37 threonylcarbamoyl transferase component Bud32
MEIGRRLGPYVIERKLGEGGMGAVYAARHERIGRLYAVKVLLPDLASRPEALVRFEREARALSALGHPNIVQVHDFAALPDGTTYLAMDLLEGIELARALGGSRALDPARARRIAMDIAAGLGAAHRIGLVHRDLKPSNVFLVGQGERERAVLLDFGLAKALGASAQTDPALANKLTASGMVLGTPHYMSPEQAQGAALDARSDVWSLGVVAYEVMTGKLPFDGPSIATVFAAILTADPMPPSALGWRGAPELEALVMHCLDRDRERRPQDGDAALAWIEGRSVAAEVGSARTIAASPATPMPATRATPSLPAPSVDLPTAIAPEPSRGVPAWAWAIGAVALVALGAVGARLGSSRTAPSTFAAPSASDAALDTDASRAVDAAVVDSAPDVFVAPPDAFVPVPEPAHRVRHAAAPPPPSSDLVGRVPPGMEAVPGARELMEAGELMQNGDWAGCLRVLSHAPQTQHVLSVEMSCASNGHDRPALTRVCGQLRQRFPASLFNQSCATLLSMPP